MAWAGGHCSDEGQDPLWWEEARPPQLISCNQHPDRQWRSWTEIGWGQMGQAQVETPSQSPWKLKQEQAGTFISCGTSPMDLALALQLPGCRNKFLLWKACLTAMMAATGSIIEVATSILPPPQCVCLSQDKDGPLQGHEVIAHHSFPIAVLCELRSPGSHNGVRTEFERMYLPDLQDGIFPGHIGRSQNSRDKQ